MFNSEEFLKSREAAEQTFYKKVRAFLVRKDEVSISVGRRPSADVLCWCVLQVLETYIFHSFLKDRLNRKMDSYARMELMTRSEVHK